MKDPSMINSSLLSTCSSRLIMKNVGNLNQFFTRNCSPFVNFNEQNTRLEDFIFLLAVEMEINADRSIEFGFNWSGKLECSILYLFFVFTFYYFNEIGTIYYDSAAFLQCHNFKTAIQKYRRDAFTYNFFLFCV